jgi:hypothetical protein
MQLIWNFLTHYLKKKSQNEREMKNSKARHFVHETLSHADAEEHVNCGEKSVCRLKNWEAKGMSVSESY